MTVVPDLSAAPPAGRVAVIEVDYATLLSTFGPPNVPTASLDTSKESHCWRLQTSAGPAQLYKWLPSTGAIPAESTTEWHIAGNTGDVASLIAQALRAQAHIHYWDRGRGLVDSLVSFVDSD